MKIGFVYDVIYPFSKGGGEKRFYNLARRLARRHEVHWLGMKLWDGPSTLVTEDGVTLHGVRKAPGRMYVDEGRRSLLQPLWFGAAVLQWPGLRTMDVIDCSSFPYFSVFSSRLLAALGRTPLVVTWHEVWADYWKAYAPRAAWAGRRIERMAMRSTPTAISVSEHTKAKLVNAGLDSSRITVVPNGTDVRVVQDAPPLTEAPDVLFAGRLIREKGVSILLEALATEPLAAITATCWIVGDGPDAEGLKRQAHGLRLMDRVRFVPWLSEAELYGAMKGAKAVALLSEREGFGMVVLEAMACGTPTVVSTGRNSAAPELVDHGRSGYVVPPNPRQVSEALASIIASPGLRASMGARGKQLAARYDWDAITAQAEAVYLQAAGLAVRGEAATAGSR
jgi:glycosyltransferase involved in cell wall biosynthesis